MKIEIASWRNIVPNVWSLHIRDAHSPMCFTNGKGATKEGALASALGEFIERLNCNFFYNDQFWGEEIANAEFVHYPDEQWFKPGPKDELPSRNPRRIHPEDLQPRRRVAWLAPVRHQLRQHPAWHLLAAVCAPVGQ